MVVVSRPLRSATTLTLLGAALAQTQGMGSAEAAGAPLAECHDMTMTFRNVSATSYDIVVKAVVTRPGIFALGDGHGFFGTSETKPNPAGVLMTSTATILNPEPGANDWVASCIGGRVTGTVRVPSPVRPPTVTVRGPLTVRASSYRGVIDPLAATAVDATGRAIPAQCPTVLPVSPARQTVTCTARDSAGRVGRATRTITVLGAAAQLAQVRDNLRTSHLRNAVAAAYRSAVEGDDRATARNLGLVLDQLRYSGLPASRVAWVEGEVRRIGHVIGRAIPLVHTVRAGESTWSIVHDALARKSGAEPTASAVAAGVRLVLAVNPGALDRFGHLQVGDVLRVPL